MKRPWHLVTASLAVVLWGSTTWAGPLVARKAGEGTGVVGPWESRVPVASDPATGDLREFLAHPFQMDGSRLSGEGLPADPGAPDLTPRTGLNLAPVATSTPPGAGTINPGTAAALEVPVGPKLAASGTASAMPPEVGEPRQPAATVVKPSDFRIPEPASLILLITGLVGLSARSYLHRHRLRT